MNVCLLLNQENGTNWGRRLWLAGGSGWPCLSRHRISWRSRRSLPQNVPLSYTHHPTAADLSKALTLLPQDR